MNKLFILLLLVLTLSATELHINMVSSTHNGTYTPRHIYVYCVEGYKYLCINNNNIIQMFEESRYTGSGSKPPQPIKCINK